MPAGATLADADAVFRGADVAYVGEALGAIGDLDADGFDDLWLGAPGGVAGLQTTAPRPGVGHVLYGDPQRLRGTTTLDAGCLPDPCDAAVTGTHASDFLSFGVTRTPVTPTSSRAPPGSPATTAPPTSSTAIAIGWRGRTPSATSPQRPSSPPPQAASRRSRWPGWGDIDGDGLADLAIAVTGTFVGYGGPAGVHVLYGSRTRRSGILPLLAAADLSIVSAAPGAAVGQGLAAGDVDADGLSDLVIGAPGLRVQGQGGSEVRVLRGGSRFTGVLGLDTLPGATAPAGGVGASLAVGELDGDPGRQVAVGAIAGNGSVLVVDGERLLAGGRSRGSPPGR